MTLRLTYWSFFPTLFKQRRLCKSQEFRIFVRDVLKTEDIGTYSEEYFNFTKMVRPGQYMDIEQFLVSGIMSKWGETDSGADHIPCIGDKDIQTAVALTILG